MNEDSSGLVEVGGGRFCYEVAGRGEPVVLVHGFSLDRRMWDDQWNVLADRYRVMRYDARGFGRSSPPERSPYANYEDLRLLIDCLGLQHPHLVGLSMGGGIVLDFAIAYPNELRSLTVIDSIVGGYTGWSQGFRRGLGYGETARHQGLQAAIEAWLTHPFFEAARQQPSVAARLRQIVGEYGGWQWLHEGSQQELQSPAVERLDSIAVPTLVLVGERDVEDFRLLAELLASNIPGAGLHVVPGVGHMANMEAPDDVNRLLLAFLAEHSGQ
jgi:3-oxoadipate enol-lactonase